METGAVPRLTIAYLSGTRPWKPGLVAEMETTLGVPIKQANTVGGRILARLGELRGLTDRVQKLLELLDPMHPVVSAETAGRNASGEGSEYVEAPAGTLWHRAIYEKGRIVHYDIVSPNTWNGSPSPGGEPQGPLETAMSRGSFSLEKADHRRSLSRIVQSFAFSMSDAVH
jgi:hydrogenase large subunit